MEVHEIFVLKVSQVMKIIKGLIKTMMKITKEEAARAIINWRVSYVW